MWFVITSYLFAFTVLTALLLHSVYSFNKVKKELKSLEHRNDKKVAKPSHHY
jgi:hypothetical protein